MENYLSKELRESVYRIIKLADSDYSDSPYINIPFFQTRFDPSELEQDVQLGPPSEYNDPQDSDRKDRLKNKEDIRQNQGLWPEKDVWYNPELPVTNTVVTVDGDPKSDAQGEPINNTTKPGGRNENRDTIGFNEGEWTDPWVDSDPSGWNDPTR